MSKETLYVFVMAFQTLNAIVTSGLTGIDLLRQISINTLVTIGLIECLSVIWAGIKKVWNALL